MKKEKLEIKGFSPVYKAVPPFMKFEGGFGYIGVLLQDEISGKLQCHLCGELADNISKHLYHKHKGITAKDYRIKMGLNLGVPLMSEKTRKLIKNNFLNLTEKKRKEIIARLKKLTKDNHKNRVWKKKGEYSSTQFLNRFGNCPEQAKTKFWNEYKKLGRIPRNKEMSESLRHLVYSRFSNYREALITWGVSEEEIRNHIVDGKMNAVQVRADNDFFPKYGKEEVKKIYSDFFFEKKRFPTWGEVRQFGMPSRCVFIRAFGANKQEVEDMLKVKEAGYN